MTIIETITNLRKVQRQILLADLVMRSVHLPLQNCPYAFDAVRMNLSPDVFAGVIDPLHRELSRNLVIGAVLMPFRPLQISAAARIHFVSGSRVRCMTVPAVALY